LAEQAQMAIRSGSIPSAAPPAASFSNRATMLPRGFCGSALVDDGGVAAGGDEPTPVLVDLPVLQLAGEPVAHAVDEHHQRQPSRRFSRRQVEIESRGAGQLDVLLDGDLGHAGDAVDDAVPRHVEGGIGARAEGEKHQEQDEATHVAERSRGGRG